MQVRTKKNSIDICVNTVIDDDLFIPKGLYKSDKEVDIIFDSGCTHAVTPHAEDFVGILIPANKIMNGLGAKVKITG